MKMNGITINVAPLFRHFWIDFQKAKGIKKLFDFSFHPNAKSYQWPVGIISDMAIQSSGYLYCKYSIAENASEGRPPKVFSL